MIMVNLKIITEGITMEINNPVIENIANPHELRNVVYTLAALFLISGIYLNMLPLEEKDGIILAYLHLPIFLWVLLGLAFTGNEYPKGSTRLAYLKFNGEFCILYASMAISGMLLTALTMQLFRFAGLRTLGSFRYIYFSFNFFLERLC